MSAANRPADGAASPHEHELLEAGRHLDADALPADLAALRGRYFVSSDHACDAFDAALAEIVAVRSSLRAVERERDQLRGFALRVIGAEDIDGGDVQDWAVELGLLVGVEATAPCGEYCSCADAEDFPTTCYRYAGALADPMREPVTEGEHG